MRQYLSELVRVSFLEHGQPVQLKIIQFQMNDKIYSACIKLMSHELHLIPYRIAC